METLNLDCLNGGFANLLIPLYITLALLLLMIPLTLFFQQGLTTPEKICTFLKSIWERTSSNEKAISFFAISLLLGLLFVTDGAYEFSWDNTDYYTLVMLIAESKTISSNEYFLGSVCIDNQCYSGRAPGYSFIAVPFYLLFKFLGGSGKVGIKFVSLLFFSFTALLVFKLGKIYSELTAVIGSILFIFGSFVIEYAIKIWNHTASLFFVTFSIYLIFLFREKQQLRYLFLSAIGIGIVFMIRYDEILYCVPIVAYLLMMPESSKKTNFRNLLIYLSIAGITTIPVFIYHYIAFGNPFTTPYSFGAEARPVTEQSLALFQIENLPYGLWNMLVVYIYPDTAWGHVVHSSLIESSPFLVFSIPGVVYLYRKKPLESKMLIFTFVLIVLFYGSSYRWGPLVQDTPLGFCFNVRYLMGLLPFLCLSSSAFIETLIKEGLTRKVNLGIIAGLVAGNLYAIYVEKTLVQVLFHSYDSIDLIASMNRTQLNQINHNLAITTLLLAMTYIVLRYYSVNLKVLEIIRGLCLAFGVVSVLGATLTNIYANIFNYAYKGGRILPFLDALRYIGIHIPGFFYYNSFLQVPVFYYIIFSLPMCYLIYNFVKRIKQDYLT